MSKVYTRTQIAYIMLTWTHSKQTTTNLSYYNWLQMNSRLRIIVIAHTIVLLLLLLPIFITYILSLRANWISRVIRKISIYMQRRSNEPATTVWVACTFIHFFFFGLIVYRWAIKLTADLFNQEYNNRVSINVSNAPRVRSRAALSRLYFYFFFII